MKNKILKKIKTAFSFSFFALFFLSCSNLVMSENPREKALKNGLLVTGSLCMEDSGISRSATANLTLSPDYFYTVQGYIYVSGTGATNLTQGFTNVSGTDISYSIELPLDGNWTIEVNAYKEFDGTAYSKPILKGFAHLVVEDSKIKTGSNTSVAMTGVTHVSEGTAFGSVALSLSVQGSSGIIEAGVSYVGVGGGASASGSDTLDFSSDSTQIWQKELSAGYYVVQFCFYNADGIILYSFADGLTVYANTVTNVWKNEGGSDFISNGSVVITDALVSAYTPKTFFVSQTGTASGDGSFFFPYDSMQTAIDRIAAINNGTSEYTVYIDGTITASPSADYGTYEVLANITGGKISIKGLNGADRDIIDCGGLAGGIRVSGGAELLLSGVTIKNGIGAVTGSNRCGGALYVGKDSFCEIRNCIITNNHAVTGGGIYNENNGKLIMKDSRVSLNSATYGGGVGNLGSFFMCGNSVIGDSSVLSAPESVEDASNSAEKFGGGIYSSGGTVCLGYSDEGVQSALSGGIYANYSNSFGAGVYIVSGTIKIADGNIRFNGLPSGAYQGAGVCTKGTLEMSGGLIDSNKCDLGAGVNVDGESGFFKLTGGTISNNISSGSGGGGGGVLVSGGATFIMSGGVIENNSATRGGGVWNWDSSTTISGGYIRQNRGTYGGGVCVFKKEFDGTETSLVTMTGGEISSNVGIDSPSSYGAGIYVERKTSFTMSGGSVSENSSTFGGAVYINLDSEGSSWGTFSMGGSAYIPYGAEGETGAGKNDVQTTMPLVIADNLTMDAPVAYITPIAYMADLPVVSGTPELLSANYRKFSLTEDSAGNEWNISEAGVLVQILPYPSLPSTVSELTEDTYGISSEEELRRLAEWVNTANKLTGKTFVLTRNISLTEEWTPIGSNASGCYFAGVFDGNGKTVSGLSVNSTDSYVGFFGKVQKGTVKNLTVEGSVTGGTNVAGLVGYANVTGTIIENCVSKVTVTQTSGTGAGGIAGSTYGDVIIRSCINLGTVTGKSSVGGICGSITGKIHNSANLGSVIADSSVGGLAGNNSSAEIKNCYNGGSVEVTESQTTKGAVDGSTGTNGTYAKVFWISGTCDSAFGTTSTVAADVTEVNKNSYELSQMAQGLDSGIYDSSVLGSDESVYKTWQYTYTMEGLPYPVCLPVT